MAAKHTYNTASKLIILNTGVTSYDAKTDFYSDSKEDWKSDAALTKFKFPITAVGGQSIGGGQTISPYYILLYGWKIRPQEANHTLTLTGNVITDDGTDVFVSTLGSYNVRIKYVVSSNSLTGGAGGATVADIWDEPIAGHNTAGTVGKALSDAGSASNPWASPVSGNTDAGTFGALMSKVLTVAKFIGLK